LGVPYLSGFVLGLGEGENIDSVCMGQIVRRGDRLDGILFVALIKSNDPLTDTTGKPAVAKV
jgi:hypothetical protein